MPPTLAVLMRNLLFTHSESLQNKSTPRLCNVKEDANSGITHLDFSSLMRIGPVTESYFTSFNAGLSECLSTHHTLTHVILACRHSRNSLPQCTDEHLRILGSNCIELVYLDVSFVRGLTGEGLKYLTPNLDLNLSECEATDTGTNKYISGCPNLKTLYIFDCGFFDKDVAKVVACLPNLEYLGYKETGKVIKHLYKNMLAKAHRIANPNDTDSEEVTNEISSNLGLKCNGLKKLSHLNNLGSKTRKLIASGLRFKKPLIEAAINVCPNIQNIKIRVTDNDVENLSGLSHLRTVEFMYNVGAGQIHSPGIGTTSFLQIRGANLTSVAFICNSVSILTLRTVGENCPNISEFWCRSNFFTISSNGYQNIEYSTDSSTLPPEVLQEHKYFQKLKTLYFRVGEGELSVVFLPSYVLQYILRNASDLKELIIAVRSSTINHQNITKLLEECNLRSLEKLLLVVPGMNSLPNILNLNMSTLYFIIDFCPAMKKLGNLLSWSLEDEVILLNDFMEEISDCNFDIEILNKKMLMR